MKRNNLFIPFLITACFLFSCQENKVLPSSSSVVIESYLIPGKPVSVKITRETPYLSEKDADTVLDYLEVRILNQDQDYLLKYQGNHVYGSGSELLVQAGETYQLAFDYQGKKVKALTSIPGKTTNFKSSVGSIALQAITSSGFSGGFPSFPDPVKLSWDNPKGDYHLIVIENTEASPKLINTTSTSTDEKRPTFRSEPVSNNVYEIQSMRFTYFGKHRLILFRINPEYAAIYKNSGSSSQNLSKPFTNISNGSGIFTGVSPSDTLNLMVNRK